MEGISFLQRILKKSGKRFAGISISYEKAWKKMDSLIDKGLSQSALEEVMNV